jgi:fatty acid desaturase
MSAHIDVRESYLRFPRWTQNFWTWLTGKALPHQKPLIRHTWFSYLGLTLAAFFAGLSLSTLAVVYKFDFWWLALLGGWVLSLASARTMILVIAHQCIHKQFSGNPRLDKFFGELVTVLNVYQDAHAFKVEHFDSHHRELIFATLGDPPVQVLLGLGFRPGMSKRQLWWRAVVVFLSPVFYWQGFASRLKCNLVSGKWRRVGFFAWAAWWLSLPFWLSNGGQALVLAFVLPIILMSQLSALLDKLGEHAWLTSPNPEHGRKNYHVAASWSRFCGRPVPARSLPLRKKLVAWPGWLLAMTFYHLPARLLVVVGDLPNHDYHHRYPATPDWMIAAYVRQQDIDRGCQDGPPYTEVWGMVGAIDRMFQALSEASPGTVLGGGVSMSALPRSKASA